MRLNIGGIFIHIPKKRIQMPNLMSAKCITEADKRKIKKKIRKILCSFGGESGMIEEKRVIAASEALPGTPHAAGRKRTRRTHACGRARQEAHSGRRVAGTEVHGSSRNATRRGQAERGRQIKWKKS